MKCNIEPRENTIGIDYWCLTHKTKATKNKNQKPDFCDCKYKDRYENIVNMSASDIKSIRIIYPNLNENTNVKVFINEKEFNGILKLENSIIDLKDYGGIMLSKLNNVDLKESICPYCGGMHSDNGKFAYKPHSQHLCIYCGRLFNVDEENIGNELSTYFNFPTPSVEKNTVQINDKCQVIYDLLTGNLLVNNISCQKVELDHKEIDLTTFLNNALKDEY